MTARPAPLLPFVLACLVTALAWPAQSGTPETPEVADPSGDVQVGGLDLTRVWFEVDGTDLLVHVERTEEGAANVQCAQGQCVGEGVAVRVLFTVLKPDGTPAPAPEGGYNGSYVLVRIGPEDANLSSAVGHFDSGGEPRPTGPGNLTQDGTRLTVTVPFGHPDLAIPASAQPGAYRLNATHAVSYALACLPDPGAPPSPAPTGCRMYEQPAPDPDPLAVWQPYWDRAPDAGFGLDYVFPSPPPPAPAAKDPVANGATQSTTTVTEVQTRTVTVTEEVTVTHTPLPIHVEGKAVPGAGLAFAVLALAAVLGVRRRLR